MVFENYIGHANGEDDGNSDVVNDNKGTIVDDHVATKSNNCNIYICDTKYSNNNNNDPTYNNSTINHNANDKDNDAKVDVVVNTGIYADIHEYANKNKTIKDAITKNSNNNHHIDIDIDIDCGLFYDTKSNGERLKVPLLDTKEDNKIDKK